MDELLERLKGLGLDPDKAGEVVTTVRNFLTEKLPDPIAAKLDEILSGSPETMQSLLEKVPTDKIPFDKIPGGDQLKGFFGGTKGA